MRCATQHSTSLLTTNPPSSALTPRLADDPTFDGWESLPDSYARRAEDAHLTVARHSEPCRPRTTARVYQAEEPLTATGGGGT